MKVMISNVAVHNNPAKFLSNFTLEIKFECLEQLTQGRVDATCRSIDHLLM